MIKKAIIFLIVFSSFGCAMTKGIIQRDTQDYSLSSFTQEAAGVAWYQELDKLDPDIYYVLATNEAQSTKAVRKAYQSISIEGIRISSPFYYFVDDKLSAFSFVCNIEQFKSLFKEDSKLLLGEDGGQPVVFGSGFVTDNTIFMLTGEGVIIYPKEKFQELAKSKMLIQPIRNK